VRVAERARLARGDNGGRAQGIKYFSKIYFLLPFFLETTVDALKVCARALGHTRTHTHTYIHTHTRAHTHTHTHTYTHILTPGGSGGGASAKRGDYGTDEVRGGPARANEED